MRSHEASVQRPTVLLDHYLKKLKLPTFLREYKATASACAQEGDDAIAFLARLAERELLEREQRAAERRVKDARFPILKTLDLFDFAAQPSINRSLILQLMRGEYLDQHENILFLWWSIWHSWSRGRRGTSFLAGCRGR